MITIVHFQQKEWWGNYFKSVHVWIKCFVAFFVGLRSCELFGMAKKKETPNLFQARELKCLKESKPMKEIEKIAKSSYWSFTEEDLHHMKIAGGKRCKRWDRGCAEGRQRMIRFRCLRWNKGCGKKTEYSFHHTENDCKIFL